MPWAVEGAATGDNKVSRASAVVGYWSCCTSSMGNLQAQGKAQVGDLDCNLNAYYNNWDGNLYKVEHGVQT